MLSKITRLFRSILLKEKQCSTRWHCCMIVTNKCRKKSMSFLLLDNPRPLVSCQGPLLGGPWTLYQPT